MKLTYGVALLDDSWLRSCQRTNLYNNSITRGICWM